MVIKNNAVITDGKEVLLRQVHPKFLIDGVLSSQAFRPSSSDDGYMSVAREKLTTPKIAHILYTGEPPNGFDRLSIGTWAITVQDFNSEKLAIYYDPLVETEKTPSDGAHSVADYNGKSETIQRKIGQRLSAKAKCVFQAKKDSDQ